MVAFVGVLKTTSKMTSIPALCNALTISKLSDQTSEWEKRNTRFQGEEAVRVVSPVVFQWLAVNFSDECPFHQSQIPGSSTAVIPNSFQVGIFSMIP